MGEGGASFSRIPALIRKNRMHKKRKIEMPGPIICRGTFVLSITNYSIHEHSRCVHKSGFITKGQATSYKLDSSSCGMWILHDLQYIQHLPCTEHPNLPSFGRECPALSRETSGGITLVVCEEQVCIGVPLFPDGIPARALHDCQWPGCQ